MLTDYLRMKLGVQQPYQGDDCGLITESHYQEEIKVQLKFIDWESDVTVVMIS